MTRNILFSRCFNILKLKQLRESVNIRNTRYMSSQEADSGDPVVFERLKGAEKGIAIYSLSNPKDRNALGRALVDNMKEVNNIIKTDTTLSVVILRSLVPGIFCAGANLKERLKMSEDQVMKFVRELRETFIQIEELPMPTIAAVDGVAVGGGLELALACDIRVVAECTKLGLVETGRGLIPGAGGTQRLPRLMHHNYAKELIFTSRIITGLEAKELGGIVNHAVPQNSSKDAAFLKALELAREILPNAPIALRCAKKAINEGLQLTLRDGYEVEQLSYNINVPTKDRTEGMISFIEKRKPVYRGH